MPAGSIARATGWEGMQYTATVTLPNLAQGLFRRRPRVVALVERCGIERYGRRLLATVQQRYGDGPLRIRNGKSNVRQPLCARGVVRRPRGGTMVLQPFQQRTPKVSR
jgi:hypothetical protein